MPCHIQIGYSGILRQFFYNITDIIRFVQVYFLLNKVKICTQIFRIIQSCSTYSQHLNSIVFQIRKITLSFKQKHPSTCCMVVFSSSKMVPIHCASFYILDDSSKDSEMDFYDLEFFFDIVIISIG